VLILREVGDVLTSPVSNRHPLRGKAPRWKASAALPFRAVGPHLMGGRLADIAVHPRLSIWHFPCLI
jgi:hypothetical protein